MRVIATLTIDGNKETRIEGESAFLDGKPGDRLEEKKLGVWLSEWRYSDTCGANHQGRVFIPWSSCLCVEELKHA